MFMYHEQCGAEEQEEDEVECEARLERKDSSRSKLESEDSSYDSDYENSEPLASPNKQHEDVSRQVSDTLGAEFAEYVQGSDPDYTNRIEFALKLGYTEKQAQVALHKLGPRPQQNELLAELIKLGACNQGPKEGAEGAGSRGGPNDSLGPSVNSRKLDSYPAEGYELRSVVIDGSNVAMSHGNKEVFSCRGIKLCVDWFKARGHKDITVFVPMWRKENSRPDAITKEQEILWELEKDRQLVFTPSRQLGGRRMACHDDRYILKLAVETEGVVVSNDNYRDLCQESPEFKRVVEERLLMYSFVNDRFMPPDDPLGRHGPSLDAFLTHKAPPTEHVMGPRVCPYGKKCTYGNKCKYYHPERGNQPHKSVSEQLAEQSKIQIQEVKARTKNIEHLDNRLKATLSSPFPSAGRAKAPLQRTKSLLPGAPSTPLTMDQPSVTITPPPPPDTSSEATRGWSLYGDHLSVAQRLSDPEQRGGGAPSAGEANNLHRKLQRQLTLNPVYDPRLVHIRNQLSMRGEWEGAPERGGPVEHAPLVRHSSAGAAERRWGPHQGVTRIASAPDSFHPFAPPNEPPPHYVWGLVPAQPPPPQHHPLVAGGGSFAEKRNHLFYHLSSIFNKEQVMAAMDAQPEETDAQAICAAILNTFPHHR